MMVITSFVCLICAAHVSWAVDVVGTVSALYSFTSPANSETQTLIDRLAVALGRASDSESNALMFSRRTLAEVDSSGACSATTDLTTPTSTGSGTGCHQVTFNVLAAADLSEYELRYRVTFWAHHFASKASDPGGAFLVAIPPRSPSNPEFTWTGPTRTLSSPVSGWTQRNYPQELWIKQASRCIAGVACESLTVAPSMRYLHSSVVYSSWNFVRDVLLHASLCKLTTETSSNAACTATCLTDTSCLTPTDFVGTWSETEYRLRISDSVFWRGSAFNSDDQFSQPTADSHVSTCPIACCGARRKCMRTRDDLGKPVPFDRTYLLVFGGRTRQKLEIDGLDLYIHCEAILASLDVSDNQSLTSCYEFQSDELWRFDIQEDTWELIKPRTVEVATSSFGQTFPYGRYAHAATLVVVEAVNDLQATRRQYMFLFGGLSVDCENGLCIDLWRYDIPWAAQAYWPTGGYANPTTWLRGNVWKRLKDCPYGGRHRHTMESTSAALYVYGGQQKGVWDDRLLVYSIASNSWDAVASQGYRFFTRSTVDYLGATRSVNVTDFSLFKPNLDFMGDTGIQASTGVHPPQFPLGRGDHSSFSIGSDRLFIANGYRTYSSPFPNPIAADNPYPSLPYYLRDDVWEYSVGSNLWRQIFIGLTQPNRPLPRKGGSTTVIPFSNDEYVLLFGGHNGDELLGDLWMYRDEDSPEWIRLDTRMDSAVYPSNVTHHTMDFDGTQLVLFGGLNWTSADLQTSDQSADTDRSCFSSGRAILKVECESGTEECALAKAIEEIQNACAESESAFCCAAGDSNIASATSLADLASVCTSVCQEESFVSELTIGFGEGVWFYTPFANCEIDCSNQGSCFFSQCVCEPGWTGRACMDPQCPGSFCYFDTPSMTHRCNHCSSHGSCDQAGRCVCDPGWSGTDCSTIACKNCSGTCIPDFPIHQCVCGPSFSGSHCDQRLCLNNCSFAGNCTPEGSCECKPNFVGMDCSVYIPTASASLSRLSAWLILAALLVL